MKENYKCCTTTYVPFSKKNFMQPYNKDMKTQINNVNYCCSCLRNISKHWVKIKVKMRTLFNKQKYSTGWSMSNSIIILKREGRGRTFENSSQYSSYPWLKKKSLLFIKTNNNNNKKFPWSSLLILSLMRKYHLTYFERSYAQCDMMCKKKSYSKQSLHRIHYDLAVK